MVCGYGRYSGRELFYYLWDWHPGLCIVEAGDLGDQVELAKEGKFLWNMGGMKALIMANQSWAEF